MAGEEVQSCGTGRVYLLFVVFRYKARGYMGGVVVLHVCDAGGFVICYRQSDGLRRNRSNNSNKD
jgi:hypothetical protein